MNLNKASSAKASYHNMIPKTEILYLGYLIKNYIIKNAVRQLKNGVPGYIYAHILHRAKSDSASD